jgi:hypothetical protein
VHGAGLSGSIGRMSPVIALLQWWVGRPSATASAVAGSTFGLRRRSGAVPLRRWAPTRGFVLFWVDVTEVGLRVSPFTIVRTPWWRPSMVEVVRWDEMLQVEPRSEALDVEAEAWESAYVPANRKVQAAAEEELKRRGFTEHVRPMMYPGRRILAAPGVEPDFRLGREGESPGFRKWVRRSGRT